MKPKTAKNPVNTLKKVLLIGDLNEDASSLHRRLTQGHFISTEENNSFFVFYRKGSAHLSLEELEGFEKLFLSIEVNYQEILHGIKIEVKENLLKIIQEDLNPKKQNYFTLKLLRLISSKGYTLAIASEQLKKDKEVVRAAIGRDFRACLFANEEGLEEDLVRKLEPIQDLLSSKENTRNRKIDKLLAKNPSVLKLLGQDFQNNPEILLTAVQANGLALQYMGEKLKQDKIKYNELAIAALKNNLDAISCTTGEFKKEQLLPMILKEAENYSLTDFVKAFLTKFTYELTWDIGKRRWSPLTASDNDISNFLFEVVQKNNSALQFINPQMQTQNMLFSTIKKNSTAINTLDSRFLRDKNFVNTLFSASVLSPNSFKDLPSEQLTLLDDEYVDISNYPKPDPRPLGNQLTLGDLHSSALKLLYILQRHRIIEVGKENYEQFAQLYIRHAKLFKTLYDLNPLYLKEKNEIARLEKFKQDFYLFETSSEGEFYEEYKNIKEELGKNIEAIKHILKSIRCLRTDVLIRLIGDILADRGSNDLFILWILADVFKEHGIPYEILFSNHDAEFLGCHMSEKTLQKTQGISANYKRSNSHLSTNQIGDPQQYNSLTNLQLLLEMELIKGRDVFLIAEHAYTSHLRLLSYSLSAEYIPQKTSLYSHAPIGMSEVAFFAETFKIEFKGNSAIGLAQTIDALNQEFAELIHDETKFMTYYRAVGDIVEIDERYALIKWPAGVKFENADIAPLLGSRRGIILRDNQLTAVDFLQHTLEERYRVIPQPRNMSLEESSKFATLCKLFPQKNKSCDYIHKNDKTNLELFESIAGVNTDPLSLVLGIAAWNRNHNLDRQNIQREGTPSRFELSFVHGHDLSNTEFSHIYNLDNTLGKGVDHNEGKYSVLTSNGNWNKIYQFHQERMSSLPLVDSSLSSLFKPRYVGCKEYLNFVQILFTKLDAPLINTGVACNKFKQTIDPLKGELQKYIQESNVKSIQTMLQTMKPRIETLKQEIEAIPQKMNFLEKVIAVLKFILWLGSFTVISRETDFQKNKAFKAQGQHFLQEIIPEIDEIQATILL